MALDALELQLAAATQRFHTIKRRAEASKEPATLLTRTLAELSTALEEVHVAHEQLIESRIRMEQLQEDLRQQAARYWQLFDEIPQPYLVTRPDTTIVEVNKAASTLFNVSQRFLVGKTMSVFVCEERAAFLAASARLAQENATAELTVKLRPRERAPMAVSARVQGDPSALRWLLTELAEPVPAANTAV